MRIPKRGRSADIEDRRGMRIGRAAPLGIGGLVLLAVLSLVTGQDFLSDAVDPTTTVGEPSTQPVPSSPELTAIEERISFVLDDSQQMWQSLLGSRYERAILVLFNDAVQSTCGFAQSATGPFYCPADHRVYIDLGFYNELRQRFGAPGDFAQAYVLAHEIGHHVQTVTGTEARMRQLQQANPRMANDLSVRLELQADCYAGVWAHSAAQRHPDLLEEGDVEEGLNAAAAIGDDRMQRMGGGRVSPENFTHGSSQQRVEWFRRGLSAGNPEACNTFSDVR